MDFHGFSCYIAVYHGMYQNGICRPPHKKVPWHVPLRNLLLRDPIDISRNILIILQHVMICDICDDPVANDLANIGSLWNIPVSFLSFLSFRTGHVAVSSVSVSQEAQEVVPNSSWDRQCEHIRTQWHDHDNTMDPKRFDKWEWHDHAAPAGCVACIAIYKLYIAIEI